MATLVALTLWFWFEISSSPSNSPRYNPQIHGYDISGLLQHGRWKLSQRVRWLCTDVWPALYHVLTVQRGQGIDMWQLPKHEAMKLLPQGSTPAQMIQTFYQAIYSYYPAEASVEEALNAIEYGVAFLRSVKLWWENSGVR
jgi:hypothetical protein